MSDQKPQKHVIFLGAGASKSSGYPLANELRLRMTSREELYKHINLAVHGKETGGVSGHLIDHLARHDRSLDLFRNGGFASVDEFCKLARGSMSDSLGELKRVMRFALCLHNPEKEFHKSDYYPFLQRLFVPDEPKLRDDVSVLSFNYDPYLEFLVGRALNHRWRACHGGTKYPPVPLRNAVHSGLFDPNSDITKESGFCILKLHGSVALPSVTESHSDVVLRHETLFKLDSGEERLKAIIKCDSYGTENLPVFFPWEVINEKGELQRADDALWSNVWKRAQSEVMAATKISFVGLSAHSYLQLGFDYLFRGKHGLCEFVVANTDNTQFSDLFTAGSGLEPFTPAGRIHQMIQKASTKKFQSKRSNNDHRNAGSGHAMTPRYSFEDFIRWEM
jgi:hypothetical protein